MIVRDTLPQSFWINWTTIQIKSPIKSYFPGQSQSFVAKQRIWSSGRIILFKDIFHLQIHENQIQFYSPILWWNDFLKSWLKFGKSEQIKFRFFIPNSSSPVDTIKLRNSTFKSNHSLLMIKSDFEFGQNLENWKFDFKIIKQKITQNVRYWIKLVRTGSRSGLASWEKLE